MKSLNEQLAVLCGMTLHYHPMCGNVYRTAEGLTMYEEGDWIPTEDLNQLRMCYEVLSEDEKRRCFEFFESLLWKEIGWVGSVDIFVAWVKHPELVAQAILKAKGVS